MELGFPLAVQVGEDWVVLDVAAGKSPADGVLVLLTATGAETIYPHLGNALLYITLLSPQLLGNVGPETAAQRAMTAFRCPDARAELARLRPQVLARLAVPYG